MNGSGYNPSSIAIKRMLGATRPVRPPRMPTPNANPKLGGSLNLRSMMRPGRAFGGPISDSPESPFTGGIMSLGAGRADDVPMHVPDGAYVVPAWGVSHLGEGNTMSGMAVLKGMFGSPWGAPKQGGPWGAPSPKLPVGKGVGIPKPPPMHFQPPNFYPQGMSAQNPADPRQKHGGAARGAGPAVPINASGGEFVIDPAEVSRIGDGNVDKGHLVLDKWLVRLKKEAANTLAKLPGPAK
jgi:hypothetical protein